MINFRKARKAVLACLAFGVSLGTSSSAPAADVACNISYPTFAIVKVELFREGDTRPTVTATNVEVHWFKTVRFTNVPSGRWYVRLTSWSFGVFQGSVGTVYWWRPWLQWLPDIRL